MDALAYHLGHTMGAADSCFKWSVSGDVGAVNADGVFTAGSRMAFGTLTCSYGSVSKSISVNVGMGDAQSAHTVADFESGLNNLTASDGVTLSRVTDYTSVARGTGSLQAMWNGTGTDGFTISVPAADASSMKHLTLWAHSRNTAGTLTAVFADAEGNELTAPLSAATGNSWKQLTASVPGRRTAVHRSAF